MELKTESKLYNITYEEHLIKNDVFLRLFGFILEENKEIQDEEGVLSIRYPRQQIIQRLIEGKKGCQRYRKSSLKHLLGRNYYPEYKGIDGEGISFIRGIK